MTDILREPTPLEIFDAAEIQRQQAREGQRQINRAHTNVAAFIQSSTNRFSPVDRTKTITQLPEDESEILRIADNFAIVIDEIQPGYLEKIKVTAQDLFMLHVEIETVACQIDPSRLHPS